MGEHPRRSCCNDGDAGRCRGIGSRLTDCQYSVRCFTTSGAAAIGIGSNTAIFPVVDAVLLRPAPFPDSDRIVIFTVLTWFRGRLIPLHVDFSGAATHGVGVMPCLHL